MDSFGTRSDIPKNDENRNFSTAVGYDLSDSENDDCSNGEGRNTRATTPFMQIQFPNKTHYFFPVPLEGLDVPVSTAQQNATATIMKESEQLESTISEMTADLECFSSPSASCIASPRPNPPRANSSPAPGPSRSGNPTDLTTCLSPGTSISMLVHTSMTTPKRPSPKPKLRTPFTKTQRMQETLYESRGEKPSNLADENQLLYQTLDYERKCLILRKGLCSFMYGALKRQGDRVDLLSSKLRKKREECAARLIFHTLLLGAYRKIQGQVSQLLMENNELKKSVENFCLQLRVVRHLQSAEKERIVEKTHEIGNLKTEIQYVKKILNKTKSDLEKAEKEIDLLHMTNTELAEEKYKIQREMRLLEEKKEMLQSSLDMEKKRSEKQMNSTKEYKRQVVELRQQVTDLKKQYDEWEERSREYEAKNYELQIVLESRGKEVIEVGRDRDILKTQCDQLEKNNLDLQSQNTSLLAEIRRQEKKSASLSKELEGAETELQKLSARFEILDKEIGKIERHNSLMKAELANYQLANTRRRRSWVNIAWTMIDPVGTLVRFFLGAPSRDGFIAWRGY